MVSLPERSDKRDAFSLQARLSNITFTIVDGVDGSKVSAKALPYVRVLYDRLYIAEADNVSRQWISDLVKSVAGEQS